LELRPEDVGDLDLLGFRVEGLAVEGLRV